MVRMLPATLSIAALLVCFLGHLPQAPARAPSGYDAPVETGRVEEADIVEASGIVASRQHRGVFWVHNDSRRKAPQRSTGPARRRDSRKKAARIADPRVWALNAEGRVVARVDLRRAEIYDWEDIAIGRRAPEKSSKSGSSEADEVPRYDIYVADTGDNDRRRERVRLWVFEEPAELVGGKTLHLDCRRIEFTFEGGPRDCEAIVKHPERPEVWLLTKEFRSIGVFRLEVSRAQSGKRLARRERSLAVGSMLTGADLTADGERLALRFYFGICELRAPRRATARENDDGRLAVFDARPTWLRAPKEPLGEAIAYTADGSALITISEGRRPALFRLERAAGSESQGNDSHSERRSKP